MDAKTRENSRLETVLPLRVGVSRGLTIPATPAQLLWRGEMPASKGSGSARSQRAISVLTQKCKSVVLEKNEGITMSTTFFESIVTAGAILSGFCGSFLTFRIQREAAYYRQPALDFATRKARDVEIKLTHFTAAFLILILATIICLLFGVVVPVLGIAGVRNAFVRPVRYRLCKKSHHSQGTRRPWQAQTPHQTVSVKFSP